MKQLNPISTEYRSKLSSDFHVDINFIYLYQPILGPEATTMYQILNAEARSMIGKGYLPIQRLIDISCLDIIDIGKIVDRLEIMGLLKTYESKNRDDKVTFVIEKPYTARQFQRNHQLMDILLLRQQKSTIETNIELLDGATFEETEDYEEITGEFSIEVEDLEIKNNFNFEPIKKMLKIADIDFSFWNEEFENLLLTAIIVDDITNIEAVQSIKDSLKDDGTIDLFIFKSILSPENTAKNISIALEGRVADKWEAKAKLLESKPTEYFKLRFEREINLEEKELLTSMTTVSKMSNSFINLIIDFVAIKNNGVFIIPYVKKIIKSVIEREISTLENLKIWLQSGVKLKETKKTKNTIMNAIKSYQSTPEPKDKKQKEEFKIKF